MGIALFEAKGFGGVQAGVHASQDGHLLGRGQRKAPLGKPGDITGIVGDQPIG
jgi:predicted deacylase